MPIWSDDYHFSLSLSLCLCLFLSLSHTHIQTCTCVVCVVPDPYMFVYDLCDVYTHTHTHTHAHICLLCFWLFFLLSSNRKSSNFWILSSLCFWFFLLCVIPLLCCPYSVFFFTFLSLILSKLLNTRKPAGESVNCDDCLWSLSIHSFCSFP